MILLLSQRLSGVSARDALPWRREGISTFGKMMELKMLLLIKILTVWHIYHII
jgi:hypothetical protein